MVCANHDIRNVQQSLYITGAVVMIFYCLQRLNAPQVFYLVYLVSAVNSAAITFVCSRRLNDDCRMDWSSGKRLIPRFTDEKSLTD